MITKVSTNLQQVYHATQAKKGGGVAQQQKEFWNEFVKENGSDQLRESNKVISDAEARLPETKLTDDSDTNLRATADRRLGPPAEISPEAKLSDDSDTNLRATVDRRLGPPAEILPETKLTDDSDTNLRAMADRKLGPPEDILPEIILNDNLKPDAAAEAGQRPDSIQSNPTEASPATLGNPADLIDELLTTWGPVIEAEDGMVSQLETALKMADAESLSAARQAASLEDLTAFLSGDGVGKVGASDDVVPVEPTGNRMEIPSEPIGDFSGETDVDFVDGLLADDSPMTSSWLAQHLGVASIISAYPEFASYLNENEEQTINFMKNVEEIQKTLSEFFNRQATEEAETVTEKDSSASGESKAEIRGDANSVDGQPSSLGAYSKDQAEGDRKGVQVSV